MGLFSGKKGLVFGIANNRSIASAIADCLQSEGAEIGYTHLPDRDPERPKNFNRLNKVIGEWNPAFMMPCNVQEDADLDAVFAKAKDTFGTIDFMLHSIAFAPTDDLAKETHQISRDGFKLAMEISVYSLLDLSRRASELMPDGGSILTLTYLGGEKVMPGYNMMGLCKSALETSVEYTAHELGPKNIRVNAVSAGPIKTLSISAVKGGDSMFTLYEKCAPLRRNVNVEEVGKAGMFLLSDMASGITGENLHVDSGYHVMGAPPTDAL